MASMCRDKAPSTVRPLASGSAGLWLTLSPLSNPLSTDSSPCALRFSLPEMSRQFNPSN